MKYIDNECKDCDEYIQPYGCTDHNCRVYKEWEEGKKEEFCDTEYRRLNRGEE